MAPAHLAIGGQTEPPHTGSNGGAGAQDQGHRVVDAQLGAQLGGLPGPGGVWLLLLLLPVSGGLGLGHSSETGLGLGLGAVGQGCLLEVIWDLG